MNNNVIIQALENNIVFFAVCLVLFLLSFFLDRFVSEKNKVFDVIGLAFIFLGGFFFLNIILLLIDLITL